MSRRLCLSPTLSPLCFKHKALFLSLSISVSLPLSLLSVFKHKALSVCLSLAFLSVPSFATPSLHFSSRCHLSLRSPLFMLPPLSVCLSVSLLSLLSPPSLSSFFLSFFLSFSPLRLSHSLVFFSLECLFRIRERNFWLLLCGKLSFTIAYSSDNAWVGCARDNETVTRWMAGQIRPLSERMRPRL